MSTTNMNNDRTDLLDMFELFLENNITLKPYYRHHKDNGAQQYLSDAKKAVRRGNTTHARLCIEWSKEAYRDLQGRNVTILKETA